MKNVAVKFCLYCVLAPAFVFACKTAPIAKPLSGASPGQVGPFVPPASWSQATWCIDNANVSTCASDNNRTCASCSCSSGDGPCLTHGSIVSRWGTPTPTIQQATTISILSNMSSADPFITAPFSVTTSGYLTYSCALNATSQAWTGTLGTVTAKSFGTGGSGTVLASTFSVGGQATDQLLVNTTHQSRAILTSLRTGSTWNISQPLTGCVPGVAGTASCSPVEVNSWASGDTVTAYTPINIYTPGGQPIANDIVDGEGFAVWITGCALQSVNGDEQSPFSGNSLISLVDVVSHRLHQDSTWGGQGAPRLVNTDVILQYHGTVSTISGGKIGFGNKFAVFNGGSLNDDVILGDVVYWYGTPGLVSQEGANSIASAYFAIGLVTYSYTTIGTQMWGPGSLYVNAGAWLQYPTGGSGATNSLLMGVIHINGATTACSHSGAAPDVVDCGISLTTAHLDASQGAAGFGGFAYSPGGGTITNVAQ